MCPLGCHASLILSDILRTLIKNTSFSGSQLSRLLEVMDARKNRACEEDSRISVGRPFFFAYYVQAPAPLVIFPATDSGFVLVMENLEGP